MTTEANLIQDEDLDYLYNFDARKSNTQPEPRMSPETSPETPPKSKAKTNPKPALSCRTNGNPRPLGRLQESKSPDTSQFSKVYTQESSIILSRDLDSQNDPNRNLNTAKGPIQGEKISKRIQQSFRKKKNSEPPRRGLEDGELKSPGAKRRISAGVTIGDQSILGGIQPLMVVNQKSQGSPKKIGISGQAIDYTPVKKPGSKKDESRQTAQFANAIKTLLDQKSVADTGLDNNQIDAISVLLGTIPVQPPRIASLKRIKKIVDVRAKEAKIAEQMMENSHLRPVRKATNDALEQKKNRVREEIKSTLIKGIKSGAIKAQKNFNPNGSFVPKAQKLERVMKKLELNSGYQENVKKDIKKFENSMFESKEEPESQKAAKEDSPGKRSKKRAKAGKDPNKLLQPDANKDPKKLSKSDPKTGARGLKAPIKTGTQTSGFFSTLARGSQAVKQMLYNRTEDENHIDSERIGLSYPNIEDTMRERSFEDHQKVQWDPMSPKKDRREKGIDQEDKLIVTGKINPKDSRNRSGAK